MAYSVKKRNNKSIITSTVTQCDTNKNELTVDVMFNENVSTVGLHIYIYTYTYIDSNLYM